MREVKMKIKPIRTEEDYKLALKEIESLMEATPDSDDFDRLEVLSLLVENYESIHYKIDIPDPIEAIKFRMEQEGLIQNDLVEIFGNKSRVSEVLNKKRKLTINMIRNLNKHLNIPFENLLGEYKLIESQ
jgi:HTH-type transcriptional regulator/antitoxin HigA